MFEYVDKYPSENCVPKPVSKFQEQLAKMGVAFHLGGRVRFWLAWPNRALQQYVGVHVITICVAFFSIYIID